MSDRLKHWHESMLSGAGGGANYAGGTFKRRHLVRRRIYRRWPANILWYAIRSALTVKGIEERFWPLSVESKIGDRLKQLRKATITNRTSGTVFEGGDCQRLL